MGNTTTNTIIVPIDINKYQSRRPKLTEQEIYEIYRGFEIYKPVNGEIETEELLKRFGNSNETAMLKRLNN